MLKRLLMLSVLSLCCAQAGGAQGSRPMQRGVVPVQTTSQQPREDFRNVPLLSALQESDGFDLSFQGEERSGKGIVQRFLITDLDNGVRMRVVLTGNTQRELVKVETQQLVDPSSFDEAQRYRADYLLGMVYGGAVVCSGQTPGTEKFMAFADWLRNGVLTALAKGSRQTLDRNFGPFRVTLTVERHTVVSGVAVLQGQERRCVLEDRP